MTIQVNLSEQHYWILAQAVSAAGTASHRHGMERHAERFHEAEKNLFRAYENQDKETDAEFTVHMRYRGESINTFEATTETLGEVIENVTDTNPNYAIEVVRE
jgi:hypothetical protein